MKTTILKEKIEQAIQILNEKNIDLWLTFVRESGNIKDPALDMIGGTGCTWQSALMISKDGDTTAIVGSLEVENFSRMGLYKNISGYMKSIKQPLLDYLIKKKPETIAINFSKNSNLADGLTHGMFLILSELLEETGFREKLISSEDIISALRGRKSKAELAIMKDAVDRTLVIFEEMTKFIKPGRTEIEISELIKKIARESNYGLAWEADHCPSVFTGPEAMSAHAGPTNRIVEKGHLVNVDFGIKFNGYCSDIQRTWYILKDGEESAPIEVEQGFAVIRDSIQKVADNLKPGVKGCEMDDIARNYIVSKGYDEFPHGLGHQVGIEAHDGGGGLLPRWEKYGNTPFIPVEKNQIYTIEPRLYIKNFGTATIEEEVFVTENGCEFISKPQKELILVKD